jgi:pre-mRNA-processing factor 19
MLHSMSKSRKKRPVPQGWAKPDDIAAFAVGTTNALPVPQATTLAVQEDYAAVGGLDGTVAIYSVEADKLERSLKVDEPVTDSIWVGSKVIVSTSKGSVKVFDSGSEVASFSDHAGAVTGLSLHPSQEILASVGSDKSFVLYDLVNLRRATRVYTNAGKFH